MKKLNKQIEEKARALNQWILKQPLVLEYQKYEALVHQNPEISQLEAELKKMQKQIVKTKHQGLDCEKLIEEYQDKKKRFDEHPIVYNYLAYKKELNDLFYQIQNDINRQLKKKID